mgnify:CR=1
MCDYREFRQDKTPQDSVHLEMTTAARAHSKIPSVLGRDSGRVLGFETSSDPSANARKVAKRIVLVPKFFKSTVFISAMFVLKQISLSRHRQQDPRP